MVLAAATAASTSSQRSKALHGGDAITGTTKDPINDVDGSILIDVYLTEKTCSLSTRVVEKSFLIIRRAIPNPLLNRNAVIKNAILVAFCDIATTQLECSTVVDVTTLIGSSFVEITELDNNGSICTAALFCLRRASDTSLTDCRKIRCASLRRADLITYTCINDHGRVGLSPGGRPMAATANAAIAIVFRILVTPTVLLASPTTEQTHSD